MGKGVMEDTMGGGKRKEKKGFKVDRYENFKAKKMGKQSNDKKKGDQQVKVKSVTFDAAHREEFLTTMHKKKNERRVQAMRDVKKKVKRENAKLKRELREDARRTFNQVSKVPILPDYSFQFPKQAISQVTEEQLGTTYHGGNSYDDAVSVQVRPLFEKPAAVPTPTKSERRNKKHKGGMDFSDLPPSVAKALEDLNAAQRGPAQMKPKANMLREMQKFHKIRQHSTKGHGKKGKAGKRKNRSK